MRNLYLPFILLVICALTSHAQTNHETWQGALDLGQEKRLNLVFNLILTPQQCSGTLDSPDQGIKGLVIDSIYRDQDSLHLSIKKLHVRFDGKIIASDSISGTFTQNGISFPLTLRSKAYRLNRPQEPQPPFPYYSEEVLVDTPDSSVVLAGTLTLPKQSGDKFPAVILISGSGPQDRNEELFGHKPFLVLSDYLTRQGIAVLRYDDRGVGQSTGRFQGATTEDLMEDASCVLNYLRTRKEIDPNHLGIIGHSEGAIIAFMLAARHDDVQFVVSMAGSALRGDSLLLMQNRTLLETHGSSPDFTAQYLAALRQIFHIKTNYSDRDIHAHKEAIADTLRMNRYPTFPKEATQNLLTVLFVKNPWLNFFLRYDPQEDLQKVRCQVLAINGNQDRQVDADVNLRLIKETLMHNGNPNCTTIQYDHLNHLFQECISGDPVEYNQIEQTISPQVLQDILEWIKKAIK